MLRLLVCRKPPADIQIRLPLVAAKVQHFKGAEVLLGGLLLTLHADQPLARRVDAELAQIGSDPFAAQLFGDGGSRAGAAEEIGDEIALIAASSDDAFKQSFWFLGWIV